MFYNTGIGTYVWVINNHKPLKSKNLVRLIDARDMGTKMRRGLGDKKKELTPEAIAEITELYSQAERKTNDRRVKVMRNEEFGYARLTIDRPLRRIWSVSKDTLLGVPVSIRTKLEKLIGGEYFELKAAEKAVASVGIMGKDAILALKAISTTDKKAEPTVSKKGTVEADPDLRDNEIISLPEGFMHLNDIDKINVVKRLADEHLTKEIHPYIPDAWVDHSKTKIGYEIPFTRQFYTYKLPRAVDDIRKEINSLENEIQHLMGGLA
jgi:type I restriction enzyme M protein